MKRHIALAIILIVLAITVAYGQRNKGMMLHNEDRYNELQAMRVYTIISALKIDVKSEKGIALLDLINRQAEESRKYFLEKDRLMDKIRDLLHSSEKVDEATVTDLILQLENLMSKNLENMKKFGDEFKALLTPVERAKLMIADETFRQRLRNAMQDRRGWRDKEPRENNMP